MSNPADYRPSNIPTEPGVYRFYDKNDRVIYVGKAKNLKNRLNSYFGSNLAAKTYRMVHTAVRVDWTIVGTEIEAPGQEALKLSRQIAIFLIGERVASLELLGSRGSMSPQEWEPHHLPGSGWHHHPRFH